jgi:DNA-binding transcriptional regulator YhcF (GntR family)
MSDADTITMKAPIAIKRRRGRKRVVAPDGTELASLSTEPEIDNTLVKAIARAYRWQRMLESGAYATVRELAKSERINPSYVSRLLALTLLPPAELEAILDGRQPEGLTLKELMRGVPIEWESFGR